MNEAFKHLSAQQIARLIQYAEGGETEGTPDGAVLHAEKNAPWVNGAFSHLRFPAYQFQPYPKRLYSAGWLRADEQYRDALNRRVRVGHEDEWKQILEDARHLRDSCVVQVENAEDERALGSGWADSPGAAVELQERLDRAVAQAAAESNYDDRNLGALAQAERAAADAASDGHLVEVPRTPVHKGKRD